MIAPFLKMSEIQVNPPGKETGIPVKFRRNIFEEGPMVPGAPDGATTGEAGQVNIFHCALHPQKPYRLLSPFLTGRMFVRRTYFGQFDEL